jgi:hypothetical protein
VFDLVTELSNIPLTASTVTVTITASEILSNTDPLDPATPAAASATNIGADGTLSGSDETNIPSSTGGLSHLTAMLEDPYLGSVARTLQLFTPPHLFCDTRDAATTKFISLQIHNHFPCTVRVFRQNFALEDAIGSHACSLEANMRVTNGITLGSSPILPVDTHKL